MSSLKKLISPYSQAQRDEIAFRESKDEIVKVEVCLKQYKEKVLKDYFDRIFEHLKSIDDKETTFLLTQSEFEQLKFLADTEEARSKLQFTENGVHTRGLPVTDVRPDRIRRDQNDSYLYNKNKRDYNFGNLNLKSLTRNQLELLVQHHREYGGRDSRPMVSEEIQKKLPSFFGEVTEKFALTSPNHAHIISTYNYSMLQDFLPERSDTKKRQSYDKWVRRIKTGLIIAAGLLFLVGGAVAFGAGVTFVGGAVLSGVGIACLLKAYAYYNNNEKTSYYHPVQDMSKKQSCMFDHNDSIKHSAQLVRTIDITTTPPTSTYHVDLSAKPYQVHVVEVKKRPVQDDAMSLSSGYGLLGSKTNEATNKNAIERAPLNRQVPSTTP